MHKPKDGRPIQYKKIRYDKPREKFSQALDRSMAEEDRRRFLNPKEKVPVYESTGTHRYDYPDWNV